MNEILSTIKGKQIYKYCTSGCCENSIPVLWISTLLKRSILRIGELNVITSIWLYYSKFKFVDPYNWTTVLRSKINNDVTFIKNAEQYLRYTNQPHFLLEYSFFRWHKFNHHYLKNFQLLNITRSPENMFDHFGRQYSYLGHLSPRHFLKMQHR